MFGDSDQPFDALRRPPDAVNPAPDVDQQAVHINHNSLAPPKH